jgi:hypothetical protein
MRTLYRSSNKRALGLSLAVVMAMPMGTLALASSVEVAVVDVTAPTGSVTLGAGGAGPNTINMIVTGNRAGTATIEANRDWNLYGGPVSGSNPQEFTVSPRADSDSPTTFSTTDTVIVA